MNFLIKYNFKEKKMKKTFLIIGLILSISLLTGCPGPNDPIVYLTFEEAVQEVYEMTGLTLFYSVDGKTPVASYNKAKGPNEIAGLCTDYAIEFAYYWNDVKNYDELYGKAYIASTSSNSTFYIYDINLVPNGTSNIRERNNSFKININNQEADGVYRDVIFTSILYTGKNILHFGSYSYSHVWPVIKIGDDWYDTEPSSWDTSLANNIPYKIIF
jgi:hypothetical protein